MVNTQIRMIIFFAAKDGEALYSRQKQLGADCGSDYEHRPYGQIQIQIEENKENH